MLLHERRPIVLDSIRDLVDVEEKVVDSRPVLIWFIDANDTVILARLRNRKKLSEDRIRIANNGSLEELRWKVDDTLFDATTLSAE
jgi:dephospho-CoA kinase